MNSLAKKAISRDDFVTIFKNTHFVDRDEPDSEDRYWKVRLRFYDNFLPHIYMVDH